MKEEMESTSSMEPKKCELNIFLWGGTFLTIISLVFSYSYLQNIDLINSDSYEIINSHHVINSHMYDSLWFENLIINYNSGNQIKTFEHSTQNITRGSSYLFAAILHTLLFVRRRGYNLKRPAYNGEIVIPTSSRYISFTVTYNETVFDFSYPCLQITPVIGNVDEPKYQYINKVNLLASYFNDTIIIYDNQQIFSNTYSTSLQIEILSSGNATDVRFPGLDQASIAGISLILLFVAIIGVLIFFWYWWSVEFIKSSHKIQLSFSTMNYYNRHH